MEDILCPEVVEVNPEYEESGSEKSERYETGFLASNNSTLRSIPGEENCITKNQGPPIIVSKLSPSKKNFKRPEKPTLTDSLNESDPDGTRFIKKDSGNTEKKKI